MRARPCPGRSTAAAPGSPGGTRTPGRRYAPTYASHARPVKNNANGSIRKLLAEGTRHCTRHTLVLSKPTQTGQSENSWQKVSATVHVTRSSCQKQRKRVNQKTPDRRYAPLYMSHARPVKNNANGSIRKLLAEGPRQRTRHTLVLSKTTQTGQSENSWQKVRANVRVTHSSCQKQHKRVNQKTPGRRSAPTYTRHTLVLSKTTQTGQSENSWQKVRTTVHVTRSSCQKQRKRVNQKTPGRRYAPLYTSHARPVKNNASGSIR